MHWGCAIGCFVVGVLTLPTIVWALLVSLRREERLYWANHRVSPNELSIGELKLGINDNQPYPWIERAL